MRKAQAGNTESAASAVGGGHVDTIGAWLEAFSKVMHATEAEKRETRAELESHLRDRSRDLMLAGLDADEAARRAIGELGEAAEIAASYRAMRGVAQRRQAMQITAIGLAAGAAVVSVAALFQGVGGGGRREVVEKVAAGEVAMVSPSVVEADVSTVEVGTPPLARVELVHGESGEVVLRARELHMVAAGEPGVVAPVEMEEYVAPADDAMAGEKGAARLVAYRVSEVMGRAFGGEASEEERAGKLVGTLTELVYSEDWVENGGSVGEMHYAGGVLFVRAPQRHQHMVGWVLGKLGSP